jgi:GT2 family glycosyltransferase
VSTVYIIVVNWNRPQLTLDCLRSLRTLDYRSYKTVVVDNGSSDDSVARIRSAFPETKVIATGKNLGFGGGNNRGIRFALENGANYVWLLNNDTIVQPNTLTKLLERACESPSIGAVGSVLCYSIDPERIQAWGGGDVNFLFGRTDHFHAPTNLGPSAFLTAASLLVRADAIQKVDGFDERYFLYWEDVDLCYRIRKAGYELAVAPDAKLVHLESATLTTNNPVQLYHSARSTVRFFRQHSRLSFAPITISSALRIGKRLARGRWREAAALANGTFRGLASELAGRV